MFETPEDRLSEIQLYELVAEEIANNQQSRGLWVKAISEGEGNHEQAKALYIKLRVEMIKDEWAYADKMAAEEVKQAEARGAAEQQRLGRVAEQQRRLHAENRRKREEKQREEYLDSVPLYVRLVVLGIIILGIVVLID
jgi:hypothetical protein